MRASYRYAASMIVKVADYNGAEKLVAGSCAGQWSELSTTLADMPLHLKASDQAGIQGKPIFDPVGTNAFIKDKLVQLSWESGVPIPSEYNFLGTDVDYVKNGVLLEVQFSNYPFLLNNTIRSEFFYKAKEPFAGHVTRLVIIVTKARMFPASNSTLYFEQGQRTLDALAKHDVFDVPIRLVGLFEQFGTEVSVTFTKYLASRYSRDVRTRLDQKCRMERGRTSRSRSMLVLS